MPWLPSLILPRLLAGCCRVQPTIGDDMGFTAYVVLTQAGVCRVSSVSAQTYRCPITAIKSFPWS